MTTGRPADKLIHRLRETCGDPRLRPQRVGLKKINSAVRVMAINKTIHPRTLTKFTKNAGVVLNGLDNFMTRQIVADACNKLKIPFVHGAIAGFCGQLDFLDNTYDQILLSFPADQSSPFQRKKVSPNFDSKVEEPKKRTGSKVRLV